MIRKMMSAVLLALLFVACPVVDAFKASSPLSTRGLPSKALGSTSKGALKTPEKTPKLAYSCSLNDGYLRSRRHLLAGIPLIIGSRVSAELSSSIHSAGSEWADHTGSFSEPDFANFQKSPTGLKFSDVVAGTGEEPKVGDSVRLHYSGYLMDGTKFDSSYRGALFPFSLVTKDAPPVAFKLEKGSLIPGFLEGVLGMKVGGRRILYIPSSLGYGERGAAGVIPPNSALIFFVELRKVGSGIVL